MQDTSPICTCAWQAYIHKDFLSPALTLNIDNEFIYASLSCPSAYRNRIKFGHKQKATVKERPRISAVNSVR